MFFFYIKMNHHPANGTRTYTTTNKYESLVWLFNLWNFIQFAFVIFIFEEWYWIAFVNMRISNKPAEENMRRLQLTSRHILSPLSTLSYKIKTASLYKKRSSLSVHSIFYYLRKMKYNKKTTNNPYIIG